MLDTFMESLGRGEVKNSNVKSETSDPYFFNFRHLIKREDECAFLVDLNALGFSKVGGPRPLLSWLRMKPAKDLMVEQMDGEGHMLVADVECDLVAALQECAAEGEVLRGR